MSNGKKEFKGMWNKYGQCVVVDAETAHLPHVNVHWYDGIGMCGTCAVLPGETNEDAATRAFGATYVKGGATRGRVGESVTIHAVELFEEYPAKPADLYAQRS